MTLRSREVSLRYNGYAMKTNMENISVNKLNINDLIERAQSKTLDRAYQDERRYAEDPYDRGGI